MIELAPQPQLHHSPEPLRTEVAVYELEPLDRLPAGDFEHTIYVSEGVLYVVLDGDEMALTSGDQIGVRRGEIQSAWNAGDDSARVVVATTR